VSVSSDSFRDVFSWTL